MTRPRIDVIPVEFDGFGRSGHQAAAAQAYLDAGLSTHPDLTFDVGESIAFPFSSTSRGPRTGLVNERALLATIDTLHDRAALALTTGGFPVVVGGDCSLLLGSFTGAQAADQGLALLFIDGHEDTTPLDVIEDGEAANTELGLLLGLTGRSPAFPRPSVVGSLAPEHLAIVGQRDDEFRREANLGSVAALGAFSRTAAETKHDPADAGLSAANSFAGGPWWLHVDLDVLDPLELPATLVPGEEEQEPGGLTWEELTHLTAAAASAGGCVGLSVAIYDPELDPDRSHAPRIVRFIHEAIAAASTGSSD